MMTEIIKRIISSIILVPLSLFFIIKGSYYFTLFILICFLTACYEWNKICYKKYLKIPGFLFLIFSFFTVYQLRNEFYGDYIYFIWILVICTFSDIGGYVSGKTFKGPKLTKISPNKTYSGMIGSYVFSVLASNVFLSNLSFFSNEVLDNFPQELNLITFVFILIVSSINQLGDVIISYFKRLSNIKDTGKIIPGHGGLLDRIDGMIFAFPFSYIILELNIFKYLNG